MFSGDLQRWLEWAVPNGWEGLPRVHSAVYLGTLQGPCVSNDMIWEPTVCELLQVLSRWKQERVSPGFKVFIVNIFMMSLFGFKEQFFGIPDDLWARIRTAVVCYILGINALTFAVLTRVKWFGLKHALVDLALRGQAARARLWFFIELESTLTDRLDRTEPKRNERAAIVERLSWEATLMPQNGVNPKEIYDGLLLKAVEAHGVVSAPQIGRKQLQRHVYAESLSQLISLTTYLLHRFQLFSRVVEPRALLERISEAAQVWRRLDLRPRLLFPLLRLFFHCFSQRKLKLSSAQ